MPKILATFLIILLAGAFSENWWLAFLVVVSGLLSIWFSKLAKLSLILTLVLVLLTAIILAWPFSFWLSYVWKFMSAILAMSLVSILPLIIHHEK